MRRRLVTFATALGLALGGPALGVVGAASVACAATDQRAALVVDTGTEARSYCVALGDDSVSGTELIRLAHDQHGLDYRLGYGGRAVCRLANVGVDGGDCFGAAPDFWGYWHGDGEGGWTWASGSAADWTVEAGDIEGWQWGPGQDGETHGAPPATTVSDVCPPATPSPSDQPGDGSGSGHGGGDDPGGGGNGPGPSASAVAATPVPNPDDREPRDRVRDEATPSPSPTGAPPVVRADGPAAPPPPGGGLVGPTVAVAAMILLGGAGAIRLRRRRAG